MKIVFNITENKNKATFQQEVVKINTSFNQTENIVKPKFQIGYYPLPSNIDLSNYYTRNEVDVLVNQTINYINDSFVNYDYTIQLKFLDYYTKVEINTQFLNYYTKTEVDTALSTKQANLGYTPENVANKSDSYTESSSTTYASSKALVDGLATKLDKPTTDGTYLVKKIGSTISYEPFSGGATKTTFTHDILVANWNLVSGKYEAVISNAGILADSFVDIIPSNDNVDIVRAAQIYPSVLISAGSIKVYSKFLPSGTISVTVNVI